MSVFQMKNCSNGCIVQTGYPTYYYFLLGYWVYKWYGMRTAYTANSPPTQCKKNIVSMWLSPLLPWVKKTLSTPLKLGNVLFSLFLKKSTTVSNVVLTKNKFHFFTFYLRFVCMWQKNKMIKPINKKGPQLINHTLSMYVRMLMYMYVFPVTSS